MMNPHVAPATRVQNFVWALVIFIVIWAPIPLGSNRSWSMLFLTAVCFLAVSVALWGEKSRIARTKPDRVYLGLLLVFAFLPFFQLLPLPFAFPHREFLEVSAEGWRAITVDQQGTLEVGLFRAGAIALSLVLLLALGETERRNALVSVMVFSASVISLYGLAVFFAESGNWITGQIAIQVSQGVSGTFVNKNHFAGYLVLIMPFAIVTALTRGNREPLSSLITTLQLLALSVLLVAFLFSGSRGGLVAFFGGLSVSLLLLGPSLRGRRVLSLKTVAVVALCIASAILVAWDFYSAKSFTLLRPMQWIDTLDLLKQGWLWGYGAGTYDLVYPSVKSAELGYLRYDHAHNDFLEFFVTYGVIGFLSLVAAFFFVLKLAFAATRLGRKFHQAPILFAGVWSLSSFVLHGVVDFNFQIPANFLIFFLIMSITVSAAKAELDK